ncbi:MAG TPA: hypothetical protein VKP30_18755 [Polyangiaceae bacterium]|nr:hypothetical protein [Polyangiaceae bacterium]
MKRLFRWASALRVFEIVWIASLCSAQAAQRARVVLITADRESATARRFIKELNTLDVDVVTVLTDESAPSIRKELERVAAEQRAFAAVRIVPTGTEAEVWVADRVTGKTLVREVISGANQGQFDEAVTLGAVELLRASLLEVATDTELKGDVAPPAAAKKLLPAPKPPTPTPTRAAAVTKPLPPAQNALALFSVGPAWDIGINHLSASQSLEFDLKVVAPSGWGGEVLYRSPFTGQELSRGEGSATLHAQHLAFMGCYSSTHGAWSPALGLGLGAAAITSTGQVVDPKMVAREEQRVRWLAFTRAGIGYRALPFLGVRVDANFGYATTPLTVRVASREAAEYGRPFASVGASFELRLPVGAVP